MGDSYGFVLVIVYEGITYVTYFVTSSVYCLVIDCCFLAF